MRTVLNSYTQIRRRSIHEKCKGPKEVIGQ